MADGQTVLHIDVTKRLGKFFLELELSLVNADITVIFGKSGAGKTAVLNLLAGLAKPDSGNILLGDCILYDAEKRIALPPEKRGLSYVFQQPRLFSHMSVKNNLLFSPRFCGRSSPRSHFEDVVDLLGIGHLLDRSPNTLSGGESQRVAIGRALLASSELLLMDEPLSSLDKNRKDELIHYISLIPERFKLPILYVTHSVDELTALADNVLLMRDGQGELLCGREAIPADIHSLI